MNTEDESLAVFSLPNNVEIQSQQSQLKKARFYRRNIGESFYYGMRNELTNERLDFLEKQASKIPLGSMIGKFTNDLHYLQTLELFIKATQETRHRGIFFLREIMPRLFFKNELLDVGPGNGELTSWIGRKFRNITLVDPSLDVLNNFNKKLKANNNLIKIQGSILDINLPLNSYDLGVLSHVLYHIERSLWLDVVVSIYSTLTSSNGLLVIALNDELDRADIVNHFGGKTLDIERFIAECSAVFHENMEVYSSKEIFKTRDIRSMLHIVNVFLHDARISVKTREVENFLNRYYKYNDFYEVSMYQYFILIKKQGS